MATREYRLTGEAIKTTRLTLGLSQREFAGRLGCSTATLSRIEAGLRRPNEHVIAAFPQAVAARPDAGAA